MSHERPTTHPLPHRAHRCRESSPSLGHRFDSPSMSYDEAAHAGVRHRSRSCAPRSRGATGMRSGRLLRGCQAPTCATSRTPLRRTVLTRPARFLSGPMPSSRHPQRPQANGIHRSAPSPSTVSMAPPRVAPEISACRAGSAPNLSLSPRRRLCRRRPISSW